MGNSNNVTTGGTSQRHSALESLGNI